MVLRLLAAAALATFASFAACGPPDGALGGHCEGTVERCDKGLKCIDNCNPNSKQIDLTCGPTCETCPTALDANGDCPGAIEHAGGGEGEGEGGQ